MITQMENSNDTFKAAVKLSVDPLAASVDWSKIETMFRQAADEFDAEDAANNVPLRKAGKRGEMARYNARDARIKAARIARQGGMYI